MSKSLAKIPMHEEQTTGIMRWLPALVVFGVLAGFLMLAWYAYHVGTQSVKDEDLLVVEADKTPIKEKPVDAGGMQFPNQDKTIYDTFANNANQPPKVERVLPKPEEPVATVTSENSDTAGWINDKYRQNEEDNQSTGFPKPEQMIAPSKSEEKEQNIAVQKPVTPEPNAMAKAASKELQLAEAKPQSDDNQPMSYIAKAPEKPVVSSAPPVVKEEKKKPVKIEPVAAPAPEKIDSAVKVQLGAYRSEAEAQDAWAAMQKKYANLLADAEPIIVKADLGAKGIYYRLRMGGFASAAEAKALCGRLAAGGQACILPTSN